MTPEVCVTFNLRNVWVLCSYASVITLRFTACDVMWSDVNSASKNSAAMFRIEEESGMALLRSNIICCIMRIIFHRISKQSFIKCHSMIRDKDTEADTGCHFYVMCFLVLL